MADRRALFDQMIVRVDLAVTGLQNLLTEYLTETAAMSGGEINGLNFPAALGLPDEVYVDNVLGIIPEPDTGRIMVMFEKTGPVDWFEICISSQQTIVDRLHHEFIYKLHLSGKNEGGIIN
jgi:hypothetical protein